MAKNIVVCSDGTGNTAIKGRGTNVFKIFEAVDLNGHRTNPHLTPQVAIYDDGVGTEDFKPIKIFAGATGFGLARNVRQLYKALVRVYDPGDHIFLFGFSRGAFTVRTLAGFISRCGLLDLAKFETARALDKGVREAYKMYRRYYRTALKKALFGDRDKSKADRFRDKNCLPGQVPIAFVGVWDTVDAVGTPFHLADFLNWAIYQFKFPNLELSANVERACHALAIDERRDAFLPVLWANDPRVEQVWFAGAHSNVGGGYPKQGMSLVALDWMMCQSSKSCLPGLRILRTDRDFYNEHSNVDDKLYDPLVGLGLFYRWAPRDIRKICSDQKVPSKIHLSVLERIAHGTQDYAPGNLPPEAKIVITTTGDDKKDAAAEQRATGVQKVLLEAHSDGEPLLSKVGSAIRLGRVSYYVYVFSCLAVLLAASVPEGAGSRFNPCAWLHSSVTLSLDTFRLKFGQLLATVMRLVSSPQLLGCLVGGLSFSLFLKKVAERRMSMVFSRTWHKAQTDLRTALKNARRESKKIM